MALVSVQFNFWHTSVGILIKRIVFGVIANAGLLLYNGLIANAVNWAAVRLSALTTALYIIISTVSTYADKDIPNTLSDTVKLEKK